MEIQYQVWDIAGDNSFKDMRKRFFMGMMGAVVVLDLNDENGTASIDKWLTDLHEKDTWKTLQSIIVVGNKCDLSSYLNENLLSRILIKWSNRFNFNLTFMKCSAKTNSKNLASNEFTIEEVFKRLAINIIIRINLLEQVNAEESDNYLFKIVILGEVGSGKTLIRRRFVRTHDEIDFSSTAGGDFNNVSRIINKDEINPFKSRE